MGRKSVIIHSIILGAAILIPQFSVNLAMAQTTTTLTTSDSTSVTSFRPRPRPRPVATPEPTSLILLGAGLAGFGIWKRTSRKD